MQLRTAPQPPVQSLLRFITPSSFEQLYRRRSASTKRVSNTLFVNTNNHHRSHHCRCSRELLITLVIDLCFHLNCGFSGFHPSYSKQYFKSFQRGSVLATIHVAHTCPYSRSTPNYLGIDSTSNFTPLFILTSILLSFQQFLDSVSHRITTTDLERSDQN